MWSLLVSYVLPAMIFAGYLALCWAVGEAAGRRGRSQPNFTVLSFFITPVIGYLALVIASSDSRREAAGKERRVRCPVCAEWIQASAIKCRFCGEFVRPPATAPVVAPAPFPQPVAGPRPAPEVAGEVVAPPAPVRVEAHPAEAARPEITSPPPAPPAPSVTVVSAARSEVSAAAGQAAALPSTPQEIHPEPAEAAPPLLAELHIPPPPQPAAADLAALPLDEKIEAMRHQPADQHPLGFYEKVKDWVRHESPEVRRAALRYLAQHCRQHSDAEELLKMVVDDADADVRATAAECLGGIFRRSRNREANAVLSDVVRDTGEEGTVRAAAMAAIRRINGH